MKSTVQKTGKHLLRALVLIISICFINSAKAQCSVSFTDSLGANGQVTYYVTANTLPNTTAYYQWSFGDGTYLNTTSNTVTHTYAYNGWFGAGVSLYDSGVGGNCWSFDSTTIHITNTATYNCNLVAGFTDTVSANGTVTCYSTSTGTTGSTMYYWYSDDGGYASGMNMTTWIHNFAYNGTYNIYLEVYDSAGGFYGCYDYAWQVVNVTGAPNTCAMNASFTTATSAQGNATFTSTSTGTNASTQYLWDPGDGSGYQYGSNVFNYQYYYNGLYTASLQIMDSNYNCVSTDTASVNITNADSCLQATYMDSVGTTTGVVWDSSTNTWDTVSYATWYFYSVSDTACSDSAQRTMQTNRPVIYTWNFGDGRRMAGRGLSNVSHIYAKAGNYQTSLTIKYNGNVRQSRAVKPVTNSPLAVNDIKDAAGSYSVYPNPSSGQFRLTLNNVKAENVEVNVTNVLGQSVYNNTYKVEDNKLSQNVELDNAPAGLYFVSVITKGKIYTSKMVITK